MNWGQYAFYHGRWQVSGLLMLPVVAALQSNFPLHISLPLGHLFGATVFYHVDQRIFGDDDE